MAVHGRVLQSGYLHLTMSNAQDATLGCGLHNKQTATIDQAIALEHLDKYGQVVESSIRKCKRSKWAKKKTLDPNTCISNDDDSSFSESVSSTEGEESEDEIISNDEVADMLLSKTIPAGASNKKASQCTKASNTSTLSCKKAHVEIEEVADIDSECPQNISMSLPSLENGTQVAALPKNQKYMAQNLIHLFFEQVDTNMHEMSKPGTKYYKCYHGNRKILAITKVMKGNLNGKSPYLFLIMF
ncbi:hypothetical protein H0H92_012143 [Tricholoma furcatifolium]|nr:hypothetical protein H0H92_012143 [Tricholoma furcatifolium]